MKSTEWTVRPEKGGDLYKIVEVDRYDFVVMRLTPTGREAVDDAEANRVLCYALGVARANVGW
jgi:hypothetical protein